MLVFTTHTMTSVSIWSWLLMSTLRYLAIRHPLFHLRLWRTPYLAIAFIVLFSALTNIWLFIGVSSDVSGCGQQYLTIGGASLNRWMLLIECIWSYCLPVIIILYVDTMVFFYCPRPSADILVGQRNESAALHGTKTNMNRIKVYISLFEHNTHVKNVYYIRTLSKLHSIECN